MEMTPEMMAAFMAQMQKNGAGQAEPQVHGGAIPSLADAKAGNANGQYFPVGHHVIEVETVSFKQTFNGLAFIVECKMLATDNPNAKVGETYSFHRSADARGKTGELQRNDIKGWICVAVEGIKPGSNPAENWDDKFTAFVAGATQPCKGLKLGVHAWEKRIRDPKPGGATTYTILDWDNVV